MSASSARSTITPNGIRIGGRVGAAIAVIPGSYLASLIWAASAPSSESGWTRQWELVQTGLVFGLVIVLIGATIGAAVGGVLGATIRLVRGADAAR